jgi:hypothetical protein
MKVIAHSYIHPKGAFLNGERKVDSSQTDENYLKTIYIALGIDYPKFYKMDNLSKLTFLADFLLSDHFPSDMDQENKLQLIFANASSSQITDLKYKDSYLVQGNPSPSLFVYTLPNILTGELSIRHKWYGENIFFIEEKFDAEFFIDQIQFSFDRGNTHCLCGWVEANVDGNEECFLFLVANNGEKITPENLMNSLKQYRNE